MQVSRVKAFSGERQSMMRASLRTTKLRWSRLRCLCGMPSWRSCLQHSTLFFLPRWPNVISQSVHDDWFHTSAKGGDYRY